MAMLSSCIQNDIPQPVVDLYIASLDVKGTDGDIVLDRSTYTATIPLAEETNIEAVEFKSITYGAEVVTNVNYTVDESKIEVSKNLNNKVVNMSQPEYITLSYFQSYEWKIVATQTINRIWTVNGQIGATEWDIENHRAVVYRRNDYPLDNVVTDALRFGPRPTYDYPESNEVPTDFNNADKSRTVTVTAHGNSTIWELVVVPTEVAIDFAYVSAGANVIWIKSAAIDGANIEFAFRKKGSEEWQKVKNEWYARDSKDAYNRYEEGFVKAVIRGLEQNTEYEVIGYADDKQSEVRSVTTSAHYQMPNSQMEEWGQFTNDQNLLPTGEAGPCWYPFSSVQQMFWATGNPGATSLGPSYNLTYPSTSVPGGSAGATSAFMGSRYVIVKFAAGNLFVGYYGETAGTNAYVYFGQPLNQMVRPTAVRFKVKYYSGGINYVSSKAASNGTEYHIGSKQTPITGGQPDLAKVFFCVTDWSKAHCVYSADETTFFDPRTADGILGIGYFDSYTNPESESIDTTIWHEMTLPIEYKSFEGNTSYIVMTFTCSGYGDYFTGSTESWMNVDDIELLYDLDENNMPK